MSQKLPARVGVIGGGRMGAGIAHAFLVSGSDVVVVEANNAAAAAAFERVAASVDKSLARGLAGTREEWLSRFSTATTKAAMANVDLAVEAVPELWDLKVATLREAESHLAEGVVLASNTSSLSITELASHVEHPQRFIGMHFFNPVPVLKLVEVVPGRQTADDTVAMIMATAMQLGKTPVEVSDAPGFVANRLLIPMINEAVFALNEGVATAEDIDTVMQLGASFPMGPLALADMIGLDVCLAIMEALHRAFGDDKYRPAPLLRQMVNSGQLGRKSGQGFHSYA